MTKTPPATALKRRPHYALLLLGLLCTGHVQASEDFIVGINTHALQDGGPVTRPIRLMLAAGVQSVREEATWSTAEQEQGYLHIAADWQRYLGALQEKSLHNLLVLGAGNPFYDDGGPPHSEAARRAFARYIEYVSHELKGEVDFYEIWNEWDARAIPASGEVGALGSARQISDADNSAPDAALQPSSDAYIRLIKDSAARLRRVDPAARILAGAVSGEGLEQGFADRLIEAGVMDSVDGLSLHPFVYCRKTLGMGTPENWIKWLGEVDRRLSNLAGRPVPLYLTAMGWPSSEDSCGISSNIQAAYLARSYLLARSRPNIKGLWWFELTNGGDSASEQAHNFGLLQADLSEKPAYAVLKVIAPLLTRYRYKTDDLLGRNNLYEMDFSNDDDHVLAAWAIGQSRQVKIETDGNVHGAVQLIDTHEPHRGRFDSDSRWVCQEHRCTAVITLSEFPKIISLGTPSWLFTR